MSRQQRSTDLYLGDGLEEIERSRLVGPSELFPPPLTGRFKTLLPLLDLGGEAFQSFGLDAVERLDRLAGARIFGRSGQTQHGIDVYGRRIDGVMAVYQMRCRTIKLTESVLRKAVSDYFGGRRPFQATWFELCWAGGDVDTKIDIERQELMQEYPGCHIEIRDQRKFTAELRVHRDLILQWFGEGVANSVYGAHAQAPTRAAAVSTDALLRGPLRAFRLEARYEAAVELVDTAPAEAAERLGEIASELRERDFPGHAAEVRTRRIEALIAAGDLERAYDESVRAVEHAVDRGWQPLSVSAMQPLLTLRSALTGGAVPAPLLGVHGVVPPAPAQIWPLEHPQIQRSFAALRADTVRIEPGESLAGLVEATRLVTEDAGSDGALPALRRLAETALIADDAAALEEAYQLATDLLPQLRPTGDADAEDDIVRLRLALADAAGDYDDLVDDARHIDIAPRLAGVVHARHARWLTWHAQPAEAEGAWLESVRAAGGQNYGEDAADYLWAAYKVHQAYESVGDLRGFDYVRRARDGRRNGRALFTESHAEINAYQQLREAQRPSTRFRPSSDDLRRSLGQALIESIIRGDLAGELDAHRMLMDLHNHLDEPAEALRHAIHAGDITAAADAEPVKIIETRSFSSSV